LGALAAITAARLPAGPLPHRRAAARPQARPHHCTRCAAAADPPASTG
jgi:hypothetical protein